MAKGRPGTYAHSRRRRGTVVNSSQTMEEINFFQKLPLELVHMILDNLSVLEVSKLCLASTQMNRCVVDYISTHAWKNKMMHHSYHYISCPEQECLSGHFRDLGVLFKRCTMLLPTKERLKCVMYTFSQVPCFLQDSCSQPNCIGFFRYGIFLQTLIAGWDDLECQKVFSFLCEVTNLLRKIEAVTTNGKPGLKCNEELELRYFCRKVLLDLSPHPSECRFWLLQLLRPWPLVSQAHLLLILYGPQLATGPISWQDLVEEVLPRNALVDLAKSIILVFNNPQNKKSSIQSTLAIFEEITVIPQEWHVHNIARLLVLCGHKLCYIILANKVQSGQITSVATIIVFIILVFEKDYNKMNWVVNLVKQLHRSFSISGQKLTFIRLLEYKCSDVMAQYLATYANGNRDENGETLLTASQLLTAIGRFHANILEGLLE
ncbi:F-box only protein 47-like isoform X1 [Corythoichthys intestinalis]|uniref:F-box only protein 47-like isoform X1 n=1 Tax=Corythoichthys intestinalis TaxID=161448 RepID=UPI0025A67EBC|nr:F-box only protein 47-like isoform X1 [Corythoichthys intestinalis]XP_057708660.1 F-box only protein 47-like isoform X1 [Corythoichthys intestinalis]XP_057708662.1 F-box only protein 47-like isoform X1 [Corythoichthys intestinalis]